MTAKEFKPSRHIEIILDASGSMGADIEGERKIDTAKKMLEMVTQSLQGEQAAVSLTAFGHRKSWSCGDIEQIFGLGFKTREEITERVKSINPSERGKTPIAEALQQAYRRLKKVKGPKGIFVITDGADTCGGDPCKIGLQLRKELDVQIYTLTYGAKNLSDLKSLACLGQVEKVENKNDILKNMAKLKASFDRDSEKKNLENSLKNLTLQSIKVLGPDAEAWASAVDLSRGTETRFLALLGASLPVGSFDVTVHYDPPFTFRGVELKEKEKKTLVVTGEGSLVLPMDYPGVELSAMNLLDSKKFRFKPGEKSVVPMGIYNVFAMTGSGMAFQWLNQVMTPGAVVELAAPPWAILEVRTAQDTTFDLFSKKDQKKSASRANFRKDVDAVKQFKDSKAFFVTNAPHVVEPGEYSLITADGQAEDHLVIGKGQKKTLLLR